MKIAYLTGIATSPALSGGAVHVSQVANLLLSHGHTLYTNFLNEPGKFVKLSEKEFYKRGKEIDVFYVRIHGSAWNDGLTSLRKANLKAPCVWEINAPMEELKTRGVPEMEIKKNIMRRKGFAKFVDAAICVSIEMEEYARDELGIKKTFVVPNGSDPGLFSPEKRDPSIYGESQFKVLWAGSTQYPWQGYNIVKKLAAELKEIDKDILIIVTGEGKISENIFYLGQISYKEIPKYMASANVGLCLYEKIDFYHKFFFSPLKLFDYMASGLPVVGSNEGQIKFVIEENKNGLLTNTSIEDLIGKILFLKQNRPLADEMGLRGRKAVIDKYNWGNTVSKIEQILSDISKEKRSSKTFHIPHTLNYWKWAIMNPKQLVNIKKIKKKLRRRIGVN